MTEADATREREEPAAPTEAATEREPAAPSESATEREPAAPQAQVFDVRMLESLVCPVSHAVLSYDSARQELVSKAARLAFPVRNGIPVMLLTEARALD